MIPQIALYATLAFAFWALRRDRQYRSGITWATWIPTLWVGILASRPVSSWLSGGVSEDAISTLEGSPLDRLFYLGMIVASLYVLSRRQVNWNELLAKNWGLFVFYGFLLASVVWANSPLVSFKRWFKEFGNILVVLVILTEADPLQALRVSFTRCGYLLIPLSYIFIRYFPYLGRRYNMHSGELEAIGVTFQKNSLGAMIFVTSLIMIWDWLQRRKETAETGPVRGMKTDTWIRWGVLLLGIYLLRMCDSKTSLLCLILASSIVLADCVPWIKKRRAALGAIAVGSCLVLYTADQMFGIRESLVQDMGRDMTFTGRTDVWRVLLNIGTDPILGTGFCSFWDDDYFQSKLPPWVSHSAHNGYVELYLSGGIVGIVMLAMMLLAVALRLNQALSWGGDYAVLRMGIFAAALVANFSESNFANMTPIGFLFLTAAIGHAESAWAQQTAAAPVETETEAEELTEENAGETSRQFC